MGGWMDGWMDGWTFNFWMVGLMDVGCMDGLTDRQCL